MKKIVIFCSVLILTVSQVSVLANTAALHNLGYVVVSPEGPDDGGNYGPQTPGTTTAGMQEAFDFAAANSKEVYIIGGGVGSSGSPVIYDLSTTLTIPWGQDWHCDGGNYVMNFTQTSGDCLVIDSQMSCFFRFGIIKAENLQSGSIVKINPVTIGPDNFNVIEVTLFEFTGIIGGPGAVGLHLLADTTPNGNISNSHFVIRSISDCNIGILLQGSRGVTNHDIQCSRIISCNDGIKVESGYLNKITAGLEAGTAGAAAVGADIPAGSQSTYHLTWLDSFSNGNALRFTGSASSNIIYAANLPVAGITNSGSNMTNLVLPVEPIGFSVATPSMSSGSYIKNTTSFKVVATIVDAGNVSSWTLRDGNSVGQTVSSGLTAGQSIILEPGESVRFIYSSAPTWVWRALR